MAPMPSRWVPNITQRQRNVYATGNPVYGGAGRSPNNGAVTDRTGYARRDMRRKAQERALQRQYEYYYRSM